MIKLLRFWVLGMLLACTLQEEVADPKGQTLIEEGEVASQHYLDHKEHLLISRIYDTEWRWAYVVDEECTKYPYTLNRYGDLKDVITEVENSIEKWLEPITGTGRVVPGGVPNRKVVNKFIAVDQSMYYERGTMKNGEDGLIRKAKPNERFNDYVFNIFFHCRGIDDAYARPDCDTCSTHCEPYDPDLGRLNRIAPDIHMFLPKRWRSLSQEYLNGYVQNIDESDDPMLIGSSGVHRGDLLHEIGHLFGLSDTYYVDDPNHYTYQNEQIAIAAHTSEDSPNPWPTRSGTLGTATNPPTMADINNPGKYHPKSTMSCHYSVDKKDKPILVDDDVETLRRLYKRIRDEGVYDN